jgi:hypothetical protein
MILVGAAERPQGLLQTLGERDEALAAKHDMGGFEARERQAEAIKTMIVYFEEDPSRRGLVNRLSAPTSKAVVQRIARALTESAGEAKT